MDWEQLDAAATIAANAPTVPVSHSPISPMVPLLPGLAFLVMAGLVGLLVAGPQPRRFTKWGWFWLITLLPAGLGAVWWLLREAPWDRHMSAEPPLPPRVTRHRYDPTGRVRRGGWTGLLAGLVLGQLLAVLLTAGLHALADHHADPVSRWTLVDGHGDATVFHADRH